MAMTTYRMKCFWSPYICIMASVMICDSDLWGFIADKLANAGQVKGKLKKISEGITWKDDYWMGSCASVDQF